MTSEWTRKILALIQNDLKLISYERIMVQNDSMLVQDWTRKTLNWIRITKLV